MLFMTPSASHVQERFEKLAPRILGGLMIATFNSCLDIFVAFLVEKTFPYIFKYAFVCRRIGVCLVYDLLVPSLLAYPLAVPIIWIYYKSLFPSLHFPTICRLEQYFTVISRVIGIVRNGSGIEDDEGRIKALGAIVQAMIEYWGLSWLAPEPESLLHSTSTWNFWWLKTLFTLLGSYFAVKALNESLGGALLKPVSRGSDWLLQAVFRLIVITYETYVEVPAYVQRIAQKTGIEAQKSFQRQLESLPSYKYKTLSTHDEIRLIKLHKFTFGEPVTVEIIHTPLNSAPSFVACSYAWGPPVFDHTIRIVSQSGATSFLRVTESAYKILSRNYFTAYQRELLWIDAICISQQDTAEKSVQVGMMRSIYELASRVDAYLDASREPFHNHYLFEQIPKLLRYVNNSTKLFVRMAHMSPRDDVWHEIEQIYSSSWFKRAWVVQEAAVARKLNIIYRTVEMDGDLFRELAIILLSLSSEAEFCKSLQMRSPNQLRTLLLENVLHAARLCQINTKLHPKLTFELRDVLNMGETKICTDPRDKVYAFLGLLSEEKCTNLPIDYNISPSELYTKAMREVLRQSRDFDDLSAAGLDNSESKIQTPSWVARWHNSRQRLSHFQHDLYAAATSRTWPGISDLKINEIQIPTRSLETIQRLQPASHLVNQIRDDLLDFSQEVVNKENGIFVDYIRSRWKFTLSYASHNHYPSQQAVKEAFWRTMCGDLVDFEARRVNASDQRRFEILEWAYGLSTLDKAAPLSDHSVFERGPPGFSISKEVWNERYRSGSQCIGHYMSHRLGVTQSGRLGLFPPSAQVDDIIVLFASANVPFIIRSECQAPSGGDRHQLIGSCYVHGIMDGEAANGPWPMVTLI